MIGSTSCRGRCYPIKSEHRAGQSLPTVARQCAADRLQNKTRRSVLGLAVWVERKSVVLYRIFTSQRLILRLTLSVLAA
jgi:hypothetical protein